MTIHDWINVAMLVLFGLAIAWSVYQNIVMKKDVTLLSVIKEAETLYNALNRIREILDVETIEKAIQEIYILKNGQPPMSDDELVMPEGEWKMDAQKGSYWVPFVKPVDKP